MGVVKNYTGEPTKIKPFNLKTEERELGRTKKRDPLMMVELMVAPGKTATIAIHRGDNPESLAKNFSKTYNLNK